jgi:hypothetical protein
MQKDMLQSIDDSALEAVSGGGVGEIIAHVREVRAAVREHVAGHVAEVVDHVGDAAGAALIRAGEVLSKIGGKLAD